MADDPDPRHASGRADPHGIPGRADPHGISGRVPDEPDLDALTREARQAAGRVTGVIAGTTLVLLHGVVGWFTLTLGLVAPPWAVAALLVAWAVAGVVAWRWRVRRPIVTMLVPFATAALVLAIVTLGGAALGWSA